MILLYLSLLLIVSSFLMFNFSYNYNGVNKTILSIPLSIAESSIPLTMQDDELYLYYDQEKFKKTYEEYLEKEITKYVTSYEVNYYFYNTKDGGYCDVNNCQGVEVKIDAFIMYGFKYHRVMNYEITRSKLYG